MLGVFFYKIPILDFFMRYLQEKIQNISFIRVENCYFFLIDVIFRTSNGNVYCYVRVHIPTVTMFCFGVCQTHPRLMFSQGNFKTKF
jgi:hypothetical protein